MPKEGDWERMRAGLREGRFGCGRERREGGRGFARVSERVGRRPLCLGERRGERRPSNNHVVQSKYDAFAHARRVHDSLGVATAADVQVPCHAGACHKKLSRCLFTHAFARTRREDQQKRPAGINIDVLVRASRLHPRGPLAAPSGRNQYYQHAGLRTLIPGRLSSPANIQHGSITSTQEVHVGTLARGDDGPPPPPQGQQKNPWRVTSLPFPGRYGSSLMASARHEGRKGGGVACTWAIPRV